MKNFSTVFDVHLRPHPNLKKVLPPLSATMLEMDVISVCFGGTSGCHWLNPEVQWNSG